MNAHAGTYSVKCTRPFSANICNVTRIVHAVSHLIPPLPFSSVHPFLAPQSTTALRSNANDAASRTSTRVASLLALVVAALSKVICAGVHDHSTADDTLRADQLDELVRCGALCVALSVSLEVAEISDMAVAVVWCTVFLVFWVNWV